jgi:hypothetical protein
MFFLYFNYFCDGRTLTYENKTATVRHTVTLALQPASRIHHHQPLQVLL